MGWRTTAQNLNLNRDYLKADAFTGTPAFRNSPYTLTYKLLPDSMIIPFKSFKTEKVISELTGADWYRYYEDTMTYMIPFFNKMEPDIDVILPEVYLIPPEWIEVIRQLELHGIKYHRLIAEQEVEIHRYRFSNPEWGKNPYEGRHTVTFEMTESVENYTYPKETVVVPMNQATAKVIAHILEPKAPDSFVHWGFFDTIFEQKEYVESYVMEERARLMLATDPDLKKSFEAKLKSDSTFAADPSAILNWFYKNSPYWDSEMNAYPVGRIFDPAILNSLNLD